MERWDESKLATVEAHFKELPEAAWTPEDHHLLVEWIAQRHLPHDELLTEREWAATKLRFKDKVDAALENLRRGVDPGRGGWEQREVERQRLAKLFREPLPLSELQVREVILPLLSKFAFGPAPEQLTGEQVQHFVRACRDPYHAETPVLVRQDIRESQGILRMQFHPAVLETSQALATNYEVLLRARRSGYAEIALSVRRDCKCMFAAFAGKVASVDGLIASFERRNDGYPVLPEPTVTCAATEDPSICRVNLIPLESTDATPPGPDEDFFRYTKQVLSGGCTELGNDWTSRLVRKPD